MFNFLYHAPRSVDPCPSSPLVVKGIFRKCLLLLRSSSPLRFGHFAFVCGVYTITPLFSNSFLFSLLPKSRQTTGRRGQKKDVDMTCGVQQYTSWIFFPLFSLQYSRHTTGKKRFRVKKINVSLVCFPQQSTYYRGKKRERKMT